MQHCQMQVWRRGADLLIKLLGFGARRTSSNMHSQHQIAINILMPLFLRYTSRVEYNGAGGRESILCPRKMIVQP